jgi:hypothetical protein
MLPNLSLKWPAKSDICWIGEADMAAIIRQKITAHYWATSYGFPLELSEYLRSIPPEAGSGSVVGRVLLTR